MTESLEARMMNIEHRVKRLERALLNRYDHQKKMEDNLINVTE